MKKRKGGGKVDVRPLDQRCKRVPFYIGHDRKKYYTPQGLSIPRRIRFPDKKE